MSIFLLEWFFKTIRSFIQCNENVFFTTSFTLSNAQDSIVIKEQLKQNNCSVKEVVRKLGIYRFQYSQTDNDYVAVIIDGKEKEITFSMDLWIDNKEPEFIESKENEFLAWLSKPNLVNR
jgi:hypothetical protein